MLTIPVEIRGRYRTKKALGKLGIAAKRMMQRHGFDKGLRRWHFFGDRSKVYNPHLNLMTPSGWLTMEQIEALKDSWAAILKIDRARVNLKVRICDTPRKILHRVRYITRATFKDWRWDEWLARELVGFRNSSAWGTWDDPPAWEVGKDEEGGMEGYRVAMLQQGLCPEDRTPITWGGLSRGRPLGRHLGGGYWMQSRK